MSTAVEFNLSDLVRNPTRVVEQAERGEVILHRRGREDLRLALASRDSGSSAVSEDLARIVGALTRDAPGREAVRVSLADAYPWLRFLPEPDRDHCRWHAETGHPKETD